MFLTSRDKSLTYRMIGVGGGVSPASCELMAFVCGFFSFCGVILITSGRINDGERLEHCLLNPAKDWAFSQRWNGVQLKSVCSRLYFHGVAGSFSILSSQLLSFALVKNRRLSFIRLKEMVFSRRRSKLLLHEQQRNWSFSLAVDCLVPRNSWETQLLK